MACLQFVFIGVVERNGRFPVLIKPLDIDKIEEAAESTIACGPDEFDIQELDFCFDGLHTAKCQERMDVLSKQCIMKEIEAARQRIRKLKTLYLLKDCARNPSSANGLNTFKGMAQDSCIYDLQ